MGLLDIIANQIITLAELSQANLRVTNELDDLGFYDKRTESIDVYLVPLGKAFGWQNWDADKGIYIPSVSLDKLKTLFGWEDVSLLDVLRHEWGHAVADTHRGLMHSREFSDVFGGAHHTGKHARYDAQKHVTAYAASNPSEDFADVFMLYLKHKGKLPKRFTKRSAIEGKWGFVRELAGAIKAGKRTW